MSGKKRKLEDEEKKNDTEPARKKQRVNDTSPVVRRNGNEEKMSRDFYDACERCDLDGIKRIRNSEGFNISFIHDLRKTGIGIGILSSGEKFPLYIAAENNHYKVVEYLLQEFRNINVNQRRLISTGMFGSLSFSDTALHIASEKGFINICKLLINHPKIDLNRKNHQQKTAFDICHYEEIRKMMLLKLEYPEKTITLDLSYTELTETSISPSNVPIVYRKEHNIGFLKLETLHKFDCKKFEKIAGFLVEDGFIESSEQFIKSEIVSDERLKSLHTEEYLQEISTSTGIAKVIELWFVALSPFFILNSFVVNPMKYQVGGTILAGELALRYGWSINLGGGMHHCSHDSGGGWCAFGDIQLAIMNLRNQNRIKKVMIIDLDAHQGNGYEKDKLDGKFGDPNDTFIVDYYFHWMYPFNKRGQLGIDIDLELEKETRNKTYNKKIRSNLRKAFKKFRDVDLVVYNAGTDILKGDPLGGSEVTPAGIMERDFIVFNICFENRTPVMMVTSGGYQQSNGRVIADSIKNLEEKLGILEIAKENYKNSFYDDEDLVFELKDDGMDDEENEGEDDD